MKKKQKYCYQCGKMMIETTHGWKCNNHPGGRLVLRPKNKSSKDYI